MNAPYTPVARPVRCVASEPGGRLLPVSTTRHPCRWRTRFPITTPKGIDMSHPLSRFAHAVLTVILSLSAGATQAADARTGWWPPFVPDEPTPAARRGRCQHIPAVRLW